MPNYYRQDVYHLGKSAQRLFDDATALERHAKHVQAQLRHIKQCRHMVAETTPQQVFDELAAGADMLSVQNEVDMIVDLLQAAD